MVGVSAEVRKLIDQLRASKPPFRCPRNGCDRVYKSFSGIKSHLATCQPACSATPVSLPGPSSRKSQRPMSWLQAQENIEISLGGSVVTLRIWENHEVLPLASNAKTSADETPSSKDPRRESSLRKTTDKGKSLEHGFEANLKYRPRKAPSMPGAYIRLADTALWGTGDGESDEVEYDMDDEDVHWLQAMNNSRASLNLPRVSDSIFEYLFDRLEKESYFQSPNGPQEGLVDDDAVCCVCNDGECENTNVILFCDMCNLAVHQECYGVPYIPEGQWLCKRCLLSPSEPVSCCLCPNLGGAMKQTSDNRWAHVACALWIPEVHFANSVFLEPIEGIHRVPTARRRLICYICKQRDAGACIQCNKSSCYTAFHVTCALSANWHLKFELGRDDSELVVVHKTALCDMHGPVEERSKGLDGGAKCETLRLQQRREQSRQNIRKTRKLLAEKRSASSTILVPVIPMRRLSQIISKVKIARKKEFFERLRAFWMLKRRSRFGVPLLRRLQVSQQTARITSYRNKSVMIRQYAKLWHSARTSLEMGRLVLELLRKREKQEREIAMQLKKVDDHKLWPIKDFLLDVLDQLDKVDEDGVFAEPVDANRVRGYRDIIKQPMDLSTMRSNVLSLRYLDVEEFAKDFDLMVNNCLKFNEGNHYFYSEGLRMKKEGGKIIQRAIVQFKKYDMTPLLDSSDESDVDSSEGKISLSERKCSSEGGSPYATRSVNSAEKCNSSSSSSTTMPSYSGVWSQLNKVVSSPNLLNNISTDGSIDGEPQAKRSRIPSTSAASPYKRLLSSLSPPNAADVNKVGNSTVPVENKLPNLFYQFRGDACSPTSESNSEVCSSSAEKENADSPLLNVTSPTTSDFIETISLEPLDLVWARFSLTAPWFPGILIDPNMKTPSKILNIPQPTEKVLRKRSMQEPYLVNLFNADNTWHWLSRCNLRPLGLDACFDNSCLRESSNAGNSQDVLNAYEQAMKYRCLITGEALPKIIEGA
ncbi:Bromodomain protein [Trichuris suis]|nr:Bromodomain protein [Trichuris suis]